MFSTLAFKKISRKLLSDQGFKWSSSSFKRFLRTRKITTNTIADMLSRYVAREMKTTP